MVFFTVASVVGAMLIERFVHLFRDSNRAFLWIMAISMGLNVLYFLLIQLMGMGAAASSIHLRETKRKMTVERKATIMVTTVGNVAMRTETLS